jgi:hypothetical protein|uniref:Uncharacterized protein n=1 Tax=Siphoviridae sp. cttG313 TaxID=2825704 RepID=A0A8S5TS72_9CAUD|nr:MAG TPA: hypothetical protein [Siphoviridae sp. cttG313]
MNDKQFTDELFSRMYVLGYRKAEIEDDTLFFFVNKRDYECLFSPRVPVKFTCFEEKDQLIDICEYLGIVDWSKVEVDTPILVRNDGIVWVRSYFAEYKSGKVRTYFNGATSWSSDGRMVSWDYAKLAEV